MPTDGLILAEIVLDPLLPVSAVAVLGVLLGVFTFWLYFKLGENISKARNVALLIFRLLGLALVLALLLQPSRLTIIPPPMTVRVLLAALDTSRSMKQQDAERAARLDAARQALVKSGIVADNGLPADAKVRLVEFSDGAKPIAGSVLDLAAKGANTRIHKSVVSTLGTLAAGEVASALILLTDGHDFEMVNPVQTGTLAKNRQTPIYALPLGKTGKVRDVATRITAYQPYTYMKQKARIAASLRLVGCEYEDITVQLLRNGAITQSKRLSAGESQELPVEFEVTEPEVGQYEYEVRAAPLEAETETANNSAITYLNVIDQQIQVLVLEGSPYWDTTFMQRSLMRNDKFVVDSLVQYGVGRVRPIRKSGQNEELKVPQTVDDFARYDVVILGRFVNQILSAKQIAALAEFAQNRGGTVIFSRGRAFEGVGENPLEPVIWKETVKEKVKLQVSREGQAAAPFRALAAESSQDFLPELIAAHESAEPKPLTATLAYAADHNDGSLVPGMVHRRFGSGQVVSIGVEGLWRWAFNAKVEGVNTAFDRFWDQIILWLLASGDFVPARQYSFRPSSANIPLGEKVYFRLLMRAPEPAVKSVPLRIYIGEREVARANLAPGAAEPQRMTAEYLPERTGRYRVLANFPDGTSQESRFIVFSENLEETEVTTDVAYLKRLCESSGGRLLAPEDLGKLFGELKNEKVDLTPKTRLTSIWDRAAVFYLAGVLFGLDWYLRRRWGLS
jgi:hypothetical protein